MMFDSVPTPFPSFAGDVLGKSKSNPTSAPSDYPFTQEDRDVQMITSEVLSLFNRTVIMSICVWRLVQYKRQGVLNLQDLKTRFHIAMLFTVPLYTPYFSFCLAHYQTWQCYFNSQQNSEALYHTAWTFYSLYRFGLSVQLVCLSMTVLQWSDFLSLSDRMGRLVYGHTDRHKNLVCYLSTINVVDVLGSLAINGYVMYNPSVAEGTDGQNLNFWIYLNWLFLDAMQISLVVFLLRQGRRMAERIQDSSAFEGRDRLKILVTLNTVLFLVVTCLAVEVLARLIGSLPLFYGLAGVKNFGKQHGTPWYMYQWLEEHHVFWQFTCYILPYDVVSFCLLYLMRAPPRKRPPSFTSTIDGCDSERRSSQSTLLGAASNTHSGGGGGGDFDGYYNSNEYPNSHHGASSSNSLAAPLVGDNGEEERGWRDGDDGGGGGGHYTCPTAAHGGDEGQQFDLDHHNYDNSIAHSKEREGVDAVREQTKGGGGDNEEDGTADPPPQPEPRGRPVHMSTDLAAGDDEDVPHHHRRVASPHGSGGGGGGGSASGGGTGGGGSHNAASYTATTTSMP